MNRTATFSRCFRAAMLALLLGGPALTAQAQVGIGTTTPDASAVLELSTTNKGLLLPRLTQVQRDAIQSPAAGLMIYQTDNTPGLYLYGGSSWSLLPNASQTTGDNLGNHTATQNLNLQGNALTGSGASISGVGVGVRADGGLNIGQNTTGGSIYLGYQAGQAATSFMAVNNVAVGYQAGMSGVSSRYNSYLGYQAGLNDNSNGFNTLVGCWSGISNTSGMGNTFMGVLSGGANTTGGFNALLGFFAGSRNTTGVSNTFVGQYAGEYNITGSNNWALGAEAGPAIGSGTITNAGALGYRAKVSQSNSLVLGGTGSEAVRVGIGTTAPAATFHVSGSSSTVRLGGLAGTGTRLVTADANGELSTTTAAGDNLGDHAATQDLNLGTNRLLGNGSTAGLAISSTGRVMLDASNVAVGLSTGNDAMTGNDNVLLGNDTGSMLTTGSLNTSMGKYSGFQLTTGSNNVFNGFNAGANTTTGTGNVFVGVGSGDFNLTGSHNTAIGSDADVDGPGLFNATAIGNQAKVSQSNALVLGGTGVDAVSVGIGTTAPAATLHVAGAASSVRLEGMAGPDTRVVTADASGNLGTTATSSLGDNLGDHTATQDISLGTNVITFGPTVQQKLNLHNTDYGLGVQTNTLYQRSINGFAWFRGGQHDDDELNPGSGGQALMVLNGSGRLGLGTITPTATWHVTGTAGTTNVRLESLGNTSNATNVVTADANGNLGTTAASSLGDNLGDHTATQDISLNSDYDLLLRGDTYHGLGFYGAGKTWSAGTALTTTATSTDVDGPVLYGFTAGLLGTNAGGTRTTALYWNNAGRVGIATTNPQATFHVAGTGGTSNVRLESLAGTGSRVVTADASGNLSTTTTASLADNLGNHTATTNLLLGSNALTGTGSSIGTTVGVGVRADGGLNLGQNTTGNNLYLGYQAGQSNTTGLGNHFVGYAAGSANTTGKGNSFSGYQAGKGTTTGNDNLFGGYNAGLANSSGSGNVFEGSEAGFSNTSGNLNTFVGYKAGYSNTSGTSNTALGYQAGPNADNLSNATAIGHNAKVGASNSLVLGATGLNAVNVGIGTTTPGARLDIQGGADSNGANDPYALAFSHRNGGYRHFVRSRHHSSVTGVGNDLDFYLNNSTTSAGSSAPGTGNTHVLTLENNNGSARVGVGTTTPAATFDVNGTAKIGSNGTTLAAVIRATVNLDIPSLGGGNSTIVSISVPNAALGATVHVSPSANLPGTMAISYARVTSTGNIDIKFINGGSNTQNAGAMDFYVTVIQ